MATKKKTPTTIFRDCIQSAFPTAEVVSVNGEWPQNTCLWQVTMDDIEGRTERVMEAARDTATHHVAEHKTTSILVSVRDGRVIVKGIE